MSDTDPRSAPAELPSDEIDLEGLARLLTACGATAFERIDGEEALLGPRHLWASLGFAPGEWPETRAALIELLHPDDRADAAPFAAQTTDDDRLLGRLRQRDGSYRRFRQRTRVTQAANGPTRVACCLIDVEDIERERDSVRQANQVLRNEAESRRTDAMRLVARASHEIRTPLNGVLGLVELARRQPANEAQQRQLDMAAQSGQALTRVLNDVLDLASLDSAQLTPRPEWVDLDELLSEALRSITPQMGWGDFAVVYDYDGELRRLKADPGRLRQIMVNLLGNAASMTRRGHVGLTAQLRLVGPDRGELRLWVEDTGPGIAPDKLPTLFEPFALAAAAKRHGGTGLGLSIVKTLVAAMEGTIAVDTVLGQGTRFELRFEFDAEPLATQAAETPGSGGHAWLLYGPPASDVAGDWLGRRLARLGWTSERVQNLADAVGRAGLVPPDVAMLAAHALQSVHDIAMLASALPNTRLVLVSRADWQRSDIQQRAHDLGMACVLAPVSHRTLQALLRSGSERVASPAAPGPVSVPALVGRVLLVDDDEVNRLVGEQILAGMQLTVTCVASGEEALAACLSMPPDVVLMDVQMIGMGGIEATRRIRAAQQRDGLKPFPVIGLTADSTAETAVACTEAGMDAVLTKPYRPEVLQAELWRRLNPTRSQPV